MEEFPANSQIARKEGAEPSKEEPKKVQQVTTGKVVVRKKPLGRRFLDTFVAGNAGGAWHYVLFEVVVPAFKDVMTDAISQGAEKLIFGEARSTSRRSGVRPASGAAGYVSYNRYSSTPAWKRDPREREEPKPTISRRARASHDFDEIVLSTRAEANEVIERMYDIIGKYDQATVSDLYDLVGLSGDFTDEKWGWTKLTGAGVQRITSGYLLNLPKPEQLD